MGDFSDLSRSYVLNDGATEPSQPQRGFGDLKAKEYTPTELIGNAVRDAMMAAGARPDVANHLTEGLGGILGLTPVGVAGSAADTVDAHRRGDGAGVVRGMARMIPGSGKVASALAREIGIGGDHALTALERK
jgi:hypothetical protein